MKHLDSLKNTLYSKANNTNNNQMSLTRERQRERDFLCIPKENCAHVELRNFHEHILYL